MSEYKKVAQFLADRLEKDKTLFQTIAVALIQKEFGVAFVYKSENGNLAIDRLVLEHFRALTPNYVWVRGGRYWRYKNESESWIDRNHTPFDIRSVILRNKSK